MYVTHPRALQAQDTEALVRELADRQAIVDALYRFGLGQDMDDPHRHRSAHRDRRRTAKLTALVEAQHLLKADHSRSALLKNLYAVDLVRDGDRWLIRRVHIDNVWFTGDPKVIFGG